MSTQTLQLDRNAMLLTALKDALKKFNPRNQMKNPVMFVTLIGAFLTTYFVLKQALNGLSWRFEGQIAAWLWFTVLFANFAEAVAEGRGKAQAESLKKARSTTFARLLKNGQETKVPAPELKKGDVFVCESGDMIPADGEIVEGIATVDESAITGESAPVLRESGGDHNAVTGGTKVLSDRILVRVTTEQGQGFLDRMIALVEGASRQKTPNEIALNLLLAGMTLIFLITIAGLKCFAVYSANSAGADLGGMDSVTVLTALLVCLIPTTIGGLLSAIGISGMDRLVRHNVIATSGKAVETAGDIDVLLLDKTGTITLGNRMASEFHPAPGVAVEDLAAAAQWASLEDETPEGRSIVILAKDQFGLRAKQPEPHEASFVPFTAQTRMSGVDFRDGRILRKGAVDSVADYVKELGGSMPEETRVSAEFVAKRGATPLAVCDGKKVLGIVELKDVVKGGIKERFADLRAMGIRTVMVTGDNPLTAAAIAAEAGVDDFMASAKPEDKLQRIREEQAKGHLVAMTGDGTNDAPALAQADVGVAMNTGTQAAREAGNMVDLDSNPTKLIQIVEVGKQLLITRGSLTTFSVSNDVAKYFAILPAMFAALYAAPGKPGPLSSLNVMGLHSPQSAILSAVIFNAVIIIALIPLALRGVAYKPMGAAAMLRRNLLIYGLGGVIIPFVGIKIIDVFVSALGWA